MQHLVSFYFVFSLTTRNLRSILFNSHFSSIIFLLIFGDFFLSVVSESTTFFSQIIYFSTASFLLSVLSSAIFHALLDTHFGLASVIEIEVEGRSNAGSGA